ncbi:tyrosine--tRNA ligase [Tepidiphilus baoligensis]|uniref:Tyrosine--tRNA ligase n=1 Tax=Tepidiphilus baoligensis TaxID=2698687 RepID=A0ABX1QLZ2_9PROT|nr:tyrosine--tRNA ligase [Tepidiphilus baoligensis]NMH16444.1 tyrosine--tRNA ligase [Tepidiphilus baoligensis]
MDVLEDLRARGLIAQTTDFTALQQRLQEGRITLYCGFDPTADSLHLGHLVPVLVLRRFQQAGHRPIALVGGATGMIGDPSFKANERKLNSLDVVAQWSERIQRQLEPFLSFEGGNPAILANNYDWFGRMNVLDFLREVGKHFSVNAMIKKEAVQQRLARDEVGISFTEFAYSLLQAYDFVELYRHHGCLLQIGGSDQWGNITAGIDLVRRLCRAEVYGLTLPLVTKADGTKFGKTESGAVWLDPRKTSPYKFYQFWLNTADADVYKFLRYFTFLSVEAIAAIEEEDRRRDKPQAQRVLAEEVTRLVHGSEALRAAERISAALFSGSLEALTEEDYAQLALDGMPTAALSREQSGLVDALVAAGLAKSKSEARTFLSSGAVAVNGVKVTALDAVIGDSDRRFGRYTVLQRGKKNHCLIVWG